MARPSTINGELLSSDQRSNVNSEESVGIQTTEESVGIQTKKFNSEHSADKTSDILPFKEKIFMNKKWSYITIGIWILCINLTILIGVLIVCLRTPKPHRICSSSFQAIIADTSLGKDSSPCSLVTGDLNDDSFTDIIIVNSGTDSIGICFNYGNGSFSSQTTFTTGEDSRPVAIVLADVNNDKSFDIVTANYDSHTIGIFLGYSNGSFANQISFFTDASRPVALAAGCLNNDSWLDIVIANNGTSSISIIFGYGNGSFGNQVTYSTGYDSFPYSLALADFNKDSYVDIVVANYGTDNIGLFFGYGNVSFHQQIIYSTGLGSGPYSVATNDFNNDGKPDIAVANSGTNSVGIFLNYGNETFITQNIYSISPGSNPRSLLIADINRDGQMDIAVINYYTNDVSVLIGYGDGSFAPPTIHSTGTGSGPFGLATGDFNNDNQTDVAVANYDINTILILIQYTMIQSPYPTNYSTGDNSDPYMILTADLNNDTQLDLIVANYGTNNVGILFGYGNGSFQEQITYSSGTNTHPYGLAVHDLDNDYKLDIVVGNSNTETLGILYGFGNGTFDKLVVYPTGKSSSIEAVIVNDFNQDNYLDIAFADFGTNSIGILYGYENRIYGNLTHYSTGDNSRPCSLAAGDVNNDSRLDIIAANYGLNNIAVLLGTNNNSFVLFTVCLTGDSSLPQMLILVDLNNDHYLDIIVANGGTNNVGIFFGLGQGYFTMQMIYSSGLVTHPSGITVGDFNSDSIVDIAVTNTATNDIGILLGNGSGYFGNQTAYTTGPASRPYAVTVGDFNKDNRLDAAVANYGSNNIVVLLGHPEKKIRNNNDSQPIIVLNDTPVLLGNYYATFLSQIVYSTGSSSHPYSIDIANLTGSTFMDIVVANSGNGQIGLIPGTGNGTFGIERTSTNTVGANPEIVLIADFNHDNQLDVACTDPRLENLIILLGNRNETDPTELIYSFDSGTDPGGLASNDLNDDKYMDLVVANKGTDKIGIFFGYDYSSFTRQNICDSGAAPTPTAVTVADFNHDGNLDIAAALYGTDNAAVFLGYGNGTFTPMITYGYVRSSHPWSIATGDVNNDTHPDLIVCNWDIDNVGILLGYGNGSFGDPLLVTTGEGSRPVVVVLDDLNNDHNLDIITANYGGNSISILIGYGNSTFQNVITCLTGDGSFPSSITISDVNNDTNQSLAWAGRPGGSSDTNLDIIVADQGIDSIGVFLGYGNGNFAEQIISSTGTNSAPWFTATFDSNKDARLDLVVANYGTSTIGILNGYGNGSFGNMQSYSTGAGSKPTAIGVADMNNDNLLDIIVGDEVTYKLGIFFGYSDGTYASMSTVDLQSATVVYSLGIGDLNNDGRLDLIIPDDGNYKIDILLASGSKPFGGQTLFALDAGSSPCSVAIGYFNNDNHLDIVAANCGTNNIGILFGYGNRSFSNIIAYYSTGDNSHPSSLAIGDFNKDSRIDIAVGNSQTDNIVIFIGYGNGNFSHFVTYSMGKNAQPVSITVAYFNEDSLLDIIVANYGTNNVCFLFGSGDGTFTNQTYYPLGYNSRPNWVVAKDLNNDGRQDIAVVTYDIDNIKVLLNIC